MNAPVVLFVYKRMDKTKKCLNALNQNIGVNDTELIIYCDGPRKEADIIDVEKVRQYIDDFKQKESKFYKVTIVKSEKNKGLATSIITGVTEVINQYETAIVVEDDLITSNDFLQYMNGALEFYKENPKIGSISAYTVPMKCLKRYRKDVFLTRKGECWGWATWKDRWEKVDWDVSSYPIYLKSKSLRKEFDALGAGLDNMLCMYMDGKLDVWAVRWCYHLFCVHQLTVYPKVSRSKNIGLDNSGEHCTSTEIYQNVISNSISECKFENLNVNKYLEKQYANYEKERKTFISRALRKILRHT